MQAPVSFTIAKKELLIVLKQLQKLEKSARKKLSVVEVTIIEGFIQLVIPGLQLQLAAQTIGSAKFTMRLWYFTDIVIAEKDNDLAFSITENQLKIRGLTFGVPTTFFETDKILRSINLPINYTQTDMYVQVISATGSFIPF